MLLRLSADDPRFRELSFNAGLNLLVADTTPVSVGTDSRNGTGKSSMVELLHFLLGARVDKKRLVMRPALCGTAFSLQLDWPGVAGGTLTVTRRGSRAEVVVLDHDVEPGADAIFDVGGPVEISVPRWAQLIEHSLFDLRGSHPGISGRAMLSFLIRRVSTHAFNSATRTYGQQSEADAAANLAYLLGLDWRLVTGYRDITAREATRRQLRKAVSDPVWGKIVGRTADLRGQIALAEQEVQRLNGEIAAFRVVPQYEELKLRADEIDHRIRGLNARDTIARRNLSDLKAAVAEATDQDVRYLEPTYRELDVLLGAQVRQRFEGVRAFHQSIVHNRRKYLAEEIRTTEEGLERTRAERATLGAELQIVLRTLNEGGALEALTALQQALAQKQAHVEALRHRYDAAQTLEASALEIKAKRVDLQRALKQDLDERQQQQREATLLFSTYARRLYGQGRQAYLAMDAEPGTLRITPHIDSDDSRGIGNMVIFCFDLALAVIAHRHGRGPDFLVHDSHLFDGVDDRQLVAAFELVREVSVEEGLQYIASLNSDDLGKVERRGFDAADSILSTRLTDAYEGGGLFGFRF